MKGHRVLPFYMTYPMPMAYEEEDVMMRDLEYLQQLYPTEAKRYQKKVSDILDKMDYEGSLIYDEYPDRFILYQLSREITDMIRKEDENQENNDSDNDNGDYVPLNRDDDCMEQMILIILFYEIYKRRHNNNRGIMRFY